MYRKFLSILLLLFAFPLLGAKCSGGWGDAVDPGSSSSTNSASLADVTFWAYQIQGLSGSGMVEALVESHYDMVVVDPTRTDWSSDDKVFDTANMVSLLKGSTGSDGSTAKLVIAYIDIGEAEDWRWYWTWSQVWASGDARPSDWPGYIVAADPDGWSGNYPVAYWNSAWKNIVIYGITTDATYKSVIDEALESGFDGVYLDWVEGFENADVLAQAAVDGVNAAQEMIDFIQEIRDYARATDPDFLVIQQNGADLINQGSGVLNAIDAIAQEEVWYGGVATDVWTNSDGYDVAIDSTLTEEYKTLLAQYQGSVPVFNVEYALDNSDTAYSNSTAEGFVPYVTRRSLSQLTTTPPTGY